MGQGMQDTGERVRRSNSGCAGAIGAVLGAFYILGASLVAQSVSYGVEQFLVEGSLRIPDTRWLVALVYSLGLLAPMGIWMALAREPRQKATARTWFLASLFSALFIPVRLVGLMDADLTSTLQVALLSLFAIGLLLWRRRRPDPGVDPALGASPIRMRGLALAGALVLAIPWVIWGALGSPLDIFLALAVGLLFGLNASLLLNTSLLDGSQPARSSADGLIFAMALLIMVTGLGQNNAQWLLALSVPVLGWAAVALARPGAASGRFRGASAPALLLGLAAAWPLLWIDPDELAAVVTSGAGELGSVALRMTGSAFVLGALLSLLFTLLADRLRQPTWRRVGLALGVALLLGLSFVHFTSNRPGFYGERLFVILKDQANLSQAAAVTDYPQRRVLVYQTLVQHAENTQAGLRAQLDRFGIPTKPYYLVNGLEVTGGPLLRLWLQSQPEVDRVLSNPMLRPLPELPETTRGSQLAPSEPQWNLKMIHADRVWNELGVRGQGVVVGQSDSGAQGEHPELASSYRGAGGVNDNNWLDPWNGSASPVDIGGHGTHTLGSILGHSVGVAPGATWIGCVNLARNLGNPAYYLDCMQFMLAPYPQQGDPLRDGNPLEGAMVLNNSWGCPTIEGCDPNALLPAVRALRVAGVFVVVSAGNSGYSGCSTITDPMAIYSEVYSVGALNEGGSLAQFSSKGPVTVDGSGRIKPDITAPGEGVLSSYPDSSYEFASGTSMAGPHVVGVVALMWSANPKLIGDIDTTTQILSRSAQPFQGQAPDCGGNRPNNAVGYGVVDAYEAVRLAREAR